MTLEEVDIHELLPQREPFVMVGRLKEFDETRTVTETPVGEDNLFVESGVFSPSGLIENVAQTCAARIGYVNKYILRKGIQLGFIGALRHFRVHRLPVVGETLRTEIVTVSEVFGMTLIEAAVRSGEDLLAECEMKIAIQERTEERG